MIYPSLSRHEDEPITGAYLQPPINKLPENFLYATKDYCIVEETNNLFIKPLEENVNNYELVINMTNKEIKLENISGENFIEQINGENGDWFTIPDTLNIKQLQFTKNNNSYIYYQIAGATENYTDNYTTYNGSIKIPDSIPESAMGLEADLRNICNIPQSKIQIDIFPLVLTYKLIYSEKEWLQLNEDGELSFTNKGVKNIVNSSEAYLIDYFHLKEGTIKILIQPSTIIGQNLRLCVSNSSIKYYFNARRNKPKIIPVEATKDDNGIIKITQFIFEKNPDLPVYLDINGITYCLQAKVYFNDVSPNNFQNYVYSGDYNCVVELGNNIYTLSINQKEYYQPLNYSTLLSPLGGFINQSLIRDFKDGVYTIEKIGIDKTKTIKIQTLDIEPKNSIYCPDGNQVFQAVWM